MAFSPCGRRWRSRMRGPSVSLNYVESLARCPPAPYNPAQRSVPRGTETRPVRSTQIGDQVRRCIRSLRTLPPRGQARGLTKSCQGTRREMNLPILPPRTGVMLCGHGSRNKLAIGEFAALAERLREKLPGVPVEYGYLEFADPVISHGLDRLRAQGVARVLAVPGMLFAAGHAKNDIPSVLNTYAAAHPGLEVTYGRELGVDLKMLRAA